MGAGLAKAAYRVADTLQLDHAPVRLYVFMAVTALDNDPEPWFSMDRGKLGAVLGNHSAHGAARAVDRAARALIDKGAVVLTPAAPNRGARYHLLDGLGSPLTPLSTGEPDERRSASHVPSTNDAQRRANERRSARERTTLSVRTNDTQRRAEEGKEETTEEESRPMNESMSEPMQTCRRHPQGWNHNDACAPCMRDRQAHEQWQAALDAQWRAELASQPRRLGSLDALERAKVDQFIRGYGGDLPPELMSAAEEARRQREQENAA